jgi:hypothetical protein
MPPIDGDGLQGPDRGFEQDGVDDGLVLERDRPDRGRHDEHDMEVGGGRKSFCLSSSQASRADPWHFGQCRLRQLL